MTTFSDPTLEQVATVLIDDETQLSQVVSALQNIKAEEYPLELLEHRRTMFVAQVRNGGRARIVYASPEMSSDTMETELLDAGYGSAGPL